jgi:hypothetical protein
MVFFIHPELIVIARWAKSDRQAEEISQSIPQLTVRPDKTPVRVLADKEC